MASSGCFPQARFCRHSAAFPSHKRSIHFNATGKPKQNAELKPRLGFARSSQQGARGSSLKWRGRSDAASTGHPTTATGRIRVCTAAWAATGAMPRIPCADSETMPISANARNTHAQAGALTGTRRRPHPPPPPRVHSHPHPGTALTPTPRTCTHTQAKPASTTTSQNTKHC